jgi:hypothetical protein
MRRYDEHETVVKGNDNDEWSSDSVVLWLGWRQNRDVVVWWGEWPRLRCHFYSSWEWESSGPGGWLIAVVRIQCLCILAREGIRRDQTLSEDEVEAASSPWLNGKETWHNTVALRRRPEERRYRGGEREEMTLAGLTRILTGLKDKENSRGRFSCYKWRVKI